MFSQARIGVVVYSLRRELLYINDFAVQRLGCRPQEVPENMTKELLRQAVVKYEDRAFEKHTWAQWMPGIGTVVTCRLEILGMESGEATGGVVFIE